ncbi:RNA 2',3'-cyclic phosphodiesterase [Nannocystis radixulma]|uniref:RNA 2',3'-cyclic phosphodiesterase n=1 Tax=Nannocystis radixulma TaxID=2995305 RepID=A0ABT5BDK4_9BACT|nr:RNA 2',3'-cyclic phosphodiesterase [Nannocystis radixulma]MDC0671076.1 RNA 2',3'-cyclic phosphodiesterase [Nannocystis radixulma]
MPRLFVGIDLPPGVDDHLEMMCYGLPDARWEGADKFHLTLRFIGEVDGRVHREIVDALQELDSPSFMLGLKGMGVFPPRGLPTSVWAGIADTGPVVALKHKVDACLRKVQDLQPDPRKFAPHVTIARVGDCTVEDVMVYLAEHALVRTEQFPVERVLLYSSVKTHRGSAYRVEAGFPLRPV